MVGLNYEEMMNTQFYTNIFSLEKNPLPLFDVDDELANFAVSVVKRYVLVLIV